MGYAMNKKGRKCMAHGSEGCEMCMANGGSVGNLDEDYEGQRHIKQKPGDTGVHSSGHFEPGRSSAGDHARAGSDKTSSQSERDYNNHAAKAIHRVVIAEQRQMKKPHGNYAEGGEVDDDDLDMVGRIMRKRGSMDSDPTPIADSESADFDYMDEIPLDHDADYTGANSGDEMGNEEQDDERDMATRIMKKRAKPKMPHPA